MLEDRRLDSFFGCSRQRSIVLATNGSQCVGGCNRLLTCSSTVTCSPKTEPKVTATSSPKTEPKAAEKFNRNSSIPIQMYSSKNDNIQIHQYIEISQDLNPSTCSSLDIFMHWAYENCNFNSTPTEMLQQQPLLFAMNRTYRTFLLWRLHLAPPVNMSLKQRVICHWSAFLVSSKSKMQCMQIFASPNVQELRNHSVTFSVSNTDFMCRLRQSRPKRNSRW